MKKGFFGIIAAFIVILCTGCSKSSGDYEAIYYVLLTGNNDIITNNDNGDHYKNMIADALEQWKAETNSTWRVNFGSSYTDADVAAKDQEAVNYFNQRVSALRTAMYNINKDINSTGSPVIVHAKWHISVCRDRSSKTLTPSQDIILDHDN